MNYDKPVTDPDPRWPHVIFALDYGIDVNSADVDVPAFAKWYRENHHLTDDEMDRTTVIMCRPRLLVRGDHTRADSDDGPTSTIRVYDHRDPNETLVHESQHADDNMHSPKLFEVSDTKKGNAQLIGGIALMAAGIANMVAAVELTNEPRQLTLGILLGAAGWLTAMLVPHTDYREHPIEKRAFATAYGEIPNFVQIEMKPLPTRLIGTIKRAGRQALTRSAAKNL